ncbi:hypothetical protein [Kitasatospora sp. NPDC088548]|uniref:hypothetical protein n=1 Tax=Kitasatospora sp. NPDC088548 TaxID=3364075 RepID=UPI0037F4B606
MSSFLPLVRGLVRAGRASNGRFVVGEGARWRRRSLVPGAELMLRGDPEQRERDDVSQAPQSGERCSYGVAVLATMATPVLVNGCVHGWCPRLPSVA